jgi:signal transduction histidine kinase/integral membrane sensor domain MASE1
MRFTGAGSARRVDFAFVAGLTAIGVAYYIGSLVGLALRLPTATPSVLWPPNAVLTSALLLMPPRRWFAGLLCALPVHIATQLPTDWPLSLILSFYATNCLEALLAAFTLRWLSDEPTSFDTVRRFGAFLCAAVVIAPLLSTFADAAVAAWFRDDSYWFVWRSRLPSNALAQLTVTPAVVGGLTRIREWLHRASMARYAEAAALGGCLLVSGWLAWGSPSDPGSPLGLAPATPLVFQLPFVLWAALRFSPVAVSLALLVMTCIAAWSGVHGGGSFQSVLPHQAILSMQVFLITSAITLLGLATLIEERRRAMHSVSERLRFEKLLFEFSRSFVQVPSRQVKAVANEWLGRAGSFFGLECVGLFQPVPSDSDMTLFAKWTRPGFSPGANNGLKRDCPWILSRILARHPVVLPNLAALPDAAHHDHASLKAQGYRAVLLMPMLAGEQLVGALAFGAANERAWPEELVANLRLMSDVLANTLARRRTDDALRASEDMKSAILDSLMSGVAVIDAEGRLLNANANWMRLAEESHFVGRREIRQGDDLLAASRPDAVNGINAVLNASRPRFEVEYTSVTPTGTRWWLLAAVRMKRTHDGAVLTLAEITDQRRAEIEVQRGRQELAHVGRLSTMGELTASLAHQLNQPLTGIMCNSQAARRLLASKRPDYAELGNTVADITHDARRASEVILRLRELLRRGESRMIAVDLTSVIRDVTKLVVSEAIIRNVAVTLDLASAPLIVCGDRVQLQQVVLNLMVNAFEAIPEGNTERAIRVSCHPVTDREVRVMVSDSGVGLTAGTEEQLFDPFYTTKPHGMGMGLAIARSIVETHGGCIRARNGQPRGTVVEFSIPMPQAVEVNEEHIQTEATSVRS